MTLGLKFLLCLNGKFFDFKNVFLLVKVFLSQGWVQQAEITVHTL